MMGGKNKVTEAPRVQRFPVLPEHQYTNATFRGGSEGRGAGGRNGPSGGREGTFLSGLIQKLTGSSRQSLGGGL